MLHEIKNMIDERIFEEEKNLTASEKFSNRHAYHHGNLHKLHVARQQIQDCITAQDRFSETEPAD